MDLLCKNWQKYTFCIYKVLLSSMILEVSWVINSFKVAWKEKLEERVTKKLRMNEIYNLQVSLMNKVLFKLSHGHLFSYCQRPLSQYKSRFDWDRNNGSEAWNIKYLAFYQYGICQYVI